MRHPWEQQIYFLKTRKIRVYWLLGELPPLKFVKLRIDGEWGVFRIYRFVILWDFIKRSQFEEGY